MGFNSGFKGLNLLKSNAMVQNVFCSTSVSLLNFTCQKHLCFINGLLIFQWPSHGSGQSLAYHCSSSVSIPSQSWWDMWWIQLHLNRFCSEYLTLCLLMWRIWWVPNNASKGQMGFNLAFKGLTVFLQYHSANASYSYYIYLPSMVYNIGN